MVHFRYSNPKVRIPVFLYREESAELHKILQVPKAEFPQSDENFEHVYYSRLDSFKGWNLQDNKIISKIESKGRPFGEVYNTRHGIATLRNDIYIFSPVNEDDRYYYIENNGVYPIEKEICKDILNSNKLSREVALKDAIEKIIFPYTIIVKKSLVY